ncbi:hypothetical protein ACMHYJ_06610 [Castellaniella hirudinis]|uniref:hypothetical protein n=1 Tax=Castellaniella hirudinis TaxID=1144617 RepID=UPI0039C18274
MLVLLTDGSINAATILAGVISTTIRPTRRFFRRRCDGFQGKCWNSQKTITDFLNGSTAVPFICLVLSAFYPGMAVIVMNNKATMAVAGAIGLIFVIGEIATAGRDD